MVTARHGCTGSCNRARMKPLHASMTFSRKIAAAAILLSGLILAQGAVNSWIARVAEERVFRGRIAGDLHAGFLDLSATKQRLKAWSLQVLLGTVPPVTEGDRLSNLLINRADDLLALGERAAALDKGTARATGQTIQAPGSEHLARAAALRTLRESFVRLRTAVLRLDAISPSGDPLGAWQSLERVFDVAGDQNLADVLGAAIARETHALALKRAAADLSLARLHTLALGATAAIVGIALLLALFAARALRRPLSEMMAGAAALQQGDLAHRIPVRSGDEFGQLANSVNSMAQELMERRNVEIVTREWLERRVEDQTRHLHDALADLQESQERRRRLIADISHELRTPTTAIRGEAEIALRGKHHGEEDYRMSLVRIGEAARHLGAVIDDLLTVARSDADALTLTHEPVELGRIVSEAVTQAGATAALRQVALQWTPSSAPLLMRGDPDRLRQQIGILLDNAIRYSHAGTTVTIEAGKQGAPGEPYKAVIAIADQGIGIPREDLEHVFERQFRAGNARRHRPDGTGLGLGLARDLARRHGGDIALSSDSEGTRAVLTLPIEPATDNFPTDMRPIHEHSAR